MSLPAAYNSSAAYFNAAIEFLHEYAWIYEHANTRCLHAGVFERMPLDMAEFFVQHVTNDQLNIFPQLQQKLQLPNATLNGFRTRLQLLTPTEMSQTEETVDTMNEDAKKKEEEEKERQITKNMRKVSVKKRHEIVKMSQLIIDVLKEAEREEGIKQKQHLLIDFGAGLGYLSETLYRRMHKKHENDRMLLLGLEADATRVATARERQKQHLPEANGDIIYEQLYIDIGAQATIEMAAQRLLNAQNDQHHDSDNDVIPITIIGLHACADLSVTAMQLFQRISHVRNLIIMPCCYHKLQLQPDGHTFTHFPLSASLRHTCATTTTPTQISAIFNRPFLRLACQETSARWADCSAAQHTAHGRVMYWRAVAEVLAQMDNNDNDTIVLTKKQQKLPNCEFERADFVDFTEFSCCYVLRSKKTGKMLAWHEKHAAKFAALQQQYANGSGAKLAEGLTCLQMAMQQLCENLILYDRRCYMEEWASDSDANVRVKVRYKKVLNEKLSPRCYALIAQKLCLC